ncbi:MAG: sensor histidine kinase [Lachnospiraceae bacterium]
MIRRIKKSYVERIFITFFISSFALEVIISVIISLTFYRIYNENVKEQGEKTTENIIHALDSLVLDYSRVINELEGEPDIHRFFLNKTDEELEMNILRTLYFIKNSYPDKAEISIVDRNSDVWISTNAENNRKKVSRYQNWGVFRKANSTRGIGIYAIAKDAVLDRKDRICLAKAYRGDGEEVLGYLLVEIPWETLYDIVSEYGSIYNTNLMIMNKSGSIIYHSKGTAFEGLGKAKEYGFVNELRQQDTETIIWKNYACQYGVYTGLYVIQELPSDAMQMIANAILRTLIPGIILIIFLGLALSTVAARSIAYPVQELKDTMSKVKSGDFSARVNVVREDEIGQLGETFNSMTERIEMLMVNIDEEKHSLWIAETRSLNLQMNPHFLYNTLDLIKWSAKLGRESEISDIVINLGCLLRKVMNTKDDLVPVSYELEIVSSFINIQKRHYGDRLCLELVLEPEMMEERIPKLTLQPIVENAVVHGFAKQIKNCIVKISAYCDTGHLYFTIEDNGEGMTEEELETVLRFRQDNTHHIGLNNVDRRARLYGDTECGLKAESRKGSGTKIMLTLRRLPQMQTDAGQAINPEEQEGDAGWCE